MTEITEKQLRQVNENLKQKKLKPLPSALPAQTNRPDGEAPPCKCGKPRVAVWVSLLERYFCVGLCVDCQAKQDIINIRTERLEKAAKYKRMLSMEIPELFLNAHIGHIPGRVLEFIKTREPGQGIYLWGKVGRGKTYIASALMRNCIVRGMRAKRSRFRDIVHEIQKTFDSNSSAEFVFEKYIKADLLSIEDVGTGKVIASEFDTETLLKLIDKRMEAKRTTIITSNKSVEGLCDSFGSRIGSRLNTFLIIELTGTDRRLG